MDKPNVMIAIPSYGSMHARSVSAFVQLTHQAGLDQARGLYTAGLWILPRVQIANARTMLAEQAIKEGFSHILYIDDDMTPPPNLIQRLLSHKKDIVGALAFLRLPPFSPVFFRLEQHPEILNYEAMLDYRDHVNSKGLVKVDGVGFGACLIRTKVFPKIMKPWFWYGDQYGEDLFFCNKAMEAGFDIWGDANCEVGHLSITHPVGELHFKAWKEHNGNSKPNVGPVVMVGENHHLREVNL